MLNDAKTYTQTNKEEKLNDAKTYTQTNKEEKNGTRAFDRYSDTDNIYLHIKSSCHDCVKG